MLFCEGSGEILDNKDLEKYPEVCREVKALKKEERELTLKRSRKESEKKAIEKFISDISDENIRRIAALRAMEGLTWAQVAAKMGHRFSEDSVRKKYKKIFEKEI